MKLIEVKVASVQQVERSNNMSFESLLNKNRCYGYDIEDGVPVLCSIKTENNVTKINILPYSCVDNDRFVKSKCYKKTITCNASSFKEQQTKDGKCLYIDSFELYPEKSYSITY